MLTRYSSTAPEATMLLKMAKRMLFETDKRLLWKLAWNMGFKGMLSGRAAQAPAQARRGLSAVPVRLDHQRCNLRCQGCWVDVAAKQETHRSPKRSTSWSREAKADGQRLLRHRRRRAVHAPAPARHAGRAPRLLLPDLHQRPVHHRREGQADAAARQRHAAHQRRGQRDRQRRAPRPGRRAAARRWRACRTA